MSVPSPRAASHTKSIHLLRALLREASYLPDAHARQYFHGYILDRFRAYQPKQNATTTAATEAMDKHQHRSFKRHRVDIIDSRTSPLQKTARKSLHYLQRANQGEIPCLRKILFLAYGRVGRRKYTLLDTVLRPDPVMDGGQVLQPKDLNGPTPLQELYFSNKQWLRYFDAPKSASEGMYVINISNRYSRLRTVLKSQHQRGIAINRELKGHTMKTPKHNIWMRPMPIVRARNNVRRWYAQTMTRLLPPLPSHEWNHMDAMVRGFEKISLVRRRKGPQSSEMEPITSAQDSVDAVLDGLRMEKLSKADKPVGAFRPHNITPKFMRRLYSQVLQLCCKVEYNEERKYWVATWGQSISPIKPSIYNAPSDEALFDGVDAKGIKPRPAKKAKSEMDPDMQPRNEKGEYVRFPFFTEYLPEDNPMRMDLEAWKKKRKAAGIIDEDGHFIGN